MYAKLKSRVDLATSSPLGPFTVLVPEATTLSQDSLLFGHTLDYLFGLLGGTHVMWNFQETYDLCGACIQTYTFEIRVGHRPTSWTSCVSLPVAISKFLSQRRTLGENACTVASCLFGGSEQFTAVRPRRMVSCQKINTFVGCRSRNSLQRLRTYVRLHTVNIAAYHDIIPRIPGSCRAGFLSTTVLTAPFAWRATVENRHSVVKPAAGWSTASQITWSCTGAKCRMMHQTQSVSDVLSDMLWPFHGLDFEPLSATGTIVRSRLCKV